MQKALLIILSVIIIIINLSATNDKGLQNSHLHDITDNIDGKIEAFLAAEREGLPVPGELLYGITDLSKYQFNSANGATRLITDAETELPFGKKFLIDVKSAGTNAWEPQLQSPVNAIALNMGNSVNADDLPMNELFYDGMEEEAEWRAVAEAGIEEYRKANIFIEVLDKSGNPVEGADITMEMKKHHFGFGSFISQLLIENSSNGDKYREHYRDLFNVGTTPFYMGGSSDNWGWYGSAWDRSNYPKFAKWFQDNNIPAKGHNLIWPGWDWMPSFFHDLSTDPSGLEKAIDDHLAELVPIGKQYGLYEWDVVNEPYINHDVMDILGEEILIDWYNRVHESDPDPKLILNEYNIIQGGGRADFQDNFIRLIEYLKEEGAPLGGIGMQCHFDENLTGIPNVLKTLDRFGELGLPIQITEFDIDTRDEDIQAAYTRDFYTAVFSHPNTEKIVMWGFYEPYMWRPNGAMIRPDWSYKPNYYVYNDLVYNKWWTNESGTTDSQGMFHARGFKGIYEISVVTPDTTYLIDINMTDESTLSIRGDEIETTVVGMRKNVAAILSSMTSFPNPFIPETTIQYTLDEASPVHLEIYDYSGRLVKQLHQVQSHPGIYNFKVAGQDFLPGIYICIASAGNTDLTNKSIILIKG